MEWFYALNGQQAGPVTEEDLHRLKQTGVVTPQTLIWKQGMANWQPYLEIFGYESAASPQSPTGSSPYGSSSMEARIAGTSGATKNSELRARARAGLSGQWFNACLGFVIYMAIIMFAALIPFGSLIIAGPMLLGVSAFCLRIARRERGDIGEILAGFSHFGASFVTFILTFLIQLAAMAAIAAPFILIGYLLLPEGFDPSQGGRIDPTTSVPLVIVMSIGYFAVIIVSMTLQIRLSIAYYCLADMTDSGVEAISLAWNMTKGKTIKLFCFMLYYFFLMLAAFISLMLISGIGSSISEMLGGALFMLSIIILLIGAMVLMPYYFVGIAAFYDDLKDAPVE